MQPIQPHYRTVQDIVLVTLREAILDGTFQPGDRLRITEIANKLDVSTMPVRQALPALEAEGFATRIPHRGYIVTAVTASDVEELYQFKKMGMRSSLRLGRGFDSESVERDWA
jgi:DNA-binding GntR family transcriptional regulator